MFLSDPPGVDKKTRRRMLDSLAALNRKQFEALGDPMIGNDWLIISFAAPVIGGAVLTGGASAFVSDRWVCR